MKGFSKKKVWLAAKVSAAVLAIVGSGSGLVNAQSSNALGANGSAEAQIRIYRALSAAADDVARQVQERSPGQASFVLYDQRILNDLLVYQGFSSGLKAMKDRLDQIKQDPTAPAGPISQDDSALITLALRRLKTQGAFSPQLLVQKMMPRPGESILPLDGGGQGTAGGEGAGSPFNTGGQAFSSLSLLGPPPSAATSSGSSGGSSGGSTGGGSGGDTLFFPNSLSTWETFATSLSPLITSFATSSSAANGVAGPTNAESFVMGKIAKELPGAFYYPSVTPIGIDLNTGPLHSLFDLQTASHTKLGQFQAVLRAYLQSSNSAVVAITRSVPPELYALDDTVHKYIKSGSPADLKDVDNRLGNLTTAVNYCPQIPKDQQDQIQKDINKELGDVLVALKKSTKVGVTLQADEIQLLQTFLRALPKFSYSPTGALSTLIADLQTSANPYGTLPLVGQLLNDIEVSLQALNNGNLFSIRTTQLMKNALYQIRNDLRTSDLKQYDVLVSIVQSVDSAVSGLNSSAPTAAAPSGGSGGGSGGGTGGGSGGGSTSGGGTTAVPPGSPPQPSFPAATDSFTTVLLRGYSYQHLLDQSAKILRVGVEMSWATDRMDMFGINLPSRKSSAAAQLSYMVFDRTGNLEMSGSSLAYIPTASAKTPLEGDRAQIERDEPRGKVVLSNASLRFEVSPATTSMTTLSIQGVCRSGKSKSANLAGASFRFQIWDPSGNVTDEGEVARISGTGKFSTIITLKHSLAKNIYKMVIFAKDGSAEDDTIVSAASYFSVT